MAPKRLPVPSPHERFRAFYAEWDRQRVARGELAPETVGRLAAREQARRERAELAAIERAWSES